ncbi:MAG: hypothetical protein ACKOAW_00870 [Actinomycetota bacterium]
MLDDPQALDALAEAMERDAAQVLETHDIRDKSALQGLLRTQATAALWLGKIDEAHALRAAALEAEDKPALRLTGMLEIDGLRAATGETSPQAAAQAFREAVGRGLAALPAGEVRTRIVEMRADLDITSAARRRGQLVAYADPVWQPDTELPIEIAGQTLWVAIRERVVGPHLPALREALTAWLASHPAPTGADIWRTRAVELTAADQPAPVAVAVWDGGVDRTVFQGRNAVAEGLAFDVDWKPTVGDLTPVPPEFDGKLAFAERITRGNGELRAGLDGPDVAFLRETIASQAIADIDAFDALNGTS